MESRHPSREIRFDGRILFAAIAALSVSWSPAASAANDSALPCNYKIAKTLKSLDVSVNEFTVSAIDHEIGASDAIVTPSYKNNSSVEDAIVAPVLDLTPRVVNILNAVFDSRSDVTLVGESVEDPSVTVENQSQDSQPKTAPVTSIDNEAEQGGFKSQMYRKDI